MTISAQRYLMEPSIESSMGTRYKPDPLSFFQEILYLRWVTSQATEAGYVRKMP